MKCALKKYCLSDKLYERIQKDVLEMSAMAVEASRYIHWDLMRKFNDGIFPQQKIDFSYYFKALCHQDRVIYVLDPEYSQLRGDLPLYDCSIRSNIREHLINQYDTVFNNNLKTHAFNRLRKFFAKFGRLNDQGQFINFKYNDMRDTLGYLFYYETDSVPDPQLLQLMTDNLGWNGEKLHDIDSDRNYKHIEIFYRLQRFNETNRFKNFKLIPQFHFGAIHIRYDTQAMFHVLNSMKLIKKGSEDVSNEQKKKSNWRRDYYQNNENARRRMWLSVFKPPETNKKKFNYSICTDGVAVSFAMEIENKKPQVANSDRISIGMYILTIGFLYAITVAH